MNKLIACAAVAAAAGLCLPHRASAQDWFVPNAQKSAPAQQTAPRGAPRAAPRQPLQGPQQQDPGFAGPGGFSEGAPPLGQDGAAEGRPQVQVQLPPAPELPPVPKGSSPPAAVLGVLSVQDVMRQSTAAQQMQKILGERSKKLNEDAQKEQASWRDMQQQLANTRSTLNAEQVRAKEAELQERVTAAQRKFRERDQIIKEAAQYGLLQVERVLEAVIQQVSASRNMNLVLHREQVMLNYPEFDLTEQVTGELNKVLPSVQIPPDGMTSVAFAAQLAKEAPAQKAAQASVTIPSPAASITTPAAQSAPAAPATPAAPAKKP
jgi:Skp family chaperone for outer membrane proteins